MINEIKQLNCFTVLALFFALLIIVFFLFLKVSLLGICVIICCMFSVSLGVGYYGNREAEKGLDSTLEAVISATETVGRIHNLVS